MTLSCWGMVYKYCWEYVFSHTTLLTYVTCYCFVACLLLTLAVVLHLLYSQRYIYVHNLIKKNKQNKPAVVVIYTGAGISTGICPFPLQITLLVKGF